MANVKKVYSVNVMEWMRGLTPDLLQLHTANYTTMPWEIFVNDILTLRPGRHIYWQNVGALSVTYNVHNSLISLSGMFKRNLRTSSCWWCKLQVQHTQDTKKISIWPRSPQQSHCAMWSHGNVSQLDESTQDFPVHPWARSHERGSVTI